MKEKRRLWILSSVLLGITSISLICEVILFLAWGFSAYLAIRALFNVFWLGMSIYGLRVSADV